MIKIKSDISLQAQSAPLSHRWYSRYKYYFKTRYTYIFFENLNFTNAYLWFELNSHGMVFYKKKKMFFSRVKYQYSRVRNICCIHLNLLKWIVFFFFCRGLEKMTKIKTFLTRLCRLKIISELFNAFFLFC